MTAHFLQGIKVLDLTNVLAGPFCCHQLVHLGADIIKIEVPGRGDLARQLGADPALNDKLMGVSFLAQNAGKRSITLNLKHDKGKDLFKILVEKADVVVENFRPGVMDRLRVGYAVLKEVNPKLVYCAISGFGQDGPMRDLPAYDQIIQGMSGVMSITGAPETAPYRVGYPICDTIGGLTAAMAIAAALNGRSEKGSTFIDVSMLEATLATMGWIVSNFLIANIEPKPLGNENFTSAPSAAFEAQDGLLNIAANKQEQFEALCGVIGREDLMKHPSYITRDLRKENRYALKVELEKTLRTRPAEAWVRDLNSAGIPSGPVFTVPDILAHPQIAERGMIAEFDNVPGVERDIRVVRTGFKVDGDAPATVSPPPCLGEHNDDVYAEFGIGAHELASLRSEGVI
ncbi:acetyl-CoA:oxalate CoA-transferase [bacterium MnTg02]|nr:acetyl-CoA:oxalate CoA-transferase [bacterium MnTg02]